MVLERGIRQSEGALRVPLVSSHPSLLFLPEKKNHHRTNQPTTATTTTGPSHPPVAGLGSRERGARCRRVPRTARASDAQLAQRERKRRATERKRRSSRRFFAKVLILNFFFSTKKIYKRKKKETNLHCKRIVSSSVFDVYCFSKREGGNNSKKGKFRGDKSEGIVFFVFCFCFIFKFPHHRRSFIHSSFHKKKVKAAPSP